MPRSFKVLLVEDDRHTREIIHRVLTRDVKLRYLNLEVLQAVNGEEGLDLYRKHEPELAIVDLLLPRVDGFEVIETIRRQGKPCQILVITGVYRDHKTRERLERLEVQLQLKPFMPQALASAVHGMLARGQRPSEPRVHKTPTRPRHSLAAMIRATRESLAAPAEAQAKVEGELADLGVSQLLLGALEDQLSGSLDLRRGKVRKVIHLMSGHPIFVQSNLRSETLGQMLVRRGKLSADQHARTLDVAKREGIKYGEALVRLGHMSEGDVMDELVEQTRLKISGCLSWRDGTWSFTEDPDVAKKVPRCVVDPVLLVFTALQRRADIEQAFASLVEKSLHRMRPTSRFILHRDRFVALFGASIIDSVNPGQMVQDVIRLAQISPQEAVLQLEVLFETGMVELDPPSETEEGAPKERPRPSPGETLRHKPSIPLERLASVEPEPAVAPESAPEAWEESSAVVWISPVERSRLVDQRPGRDTSEVQVALQLIQSAYLTLHDANHYQVLGVTSQSDVDSVEVAYQIKRKQFDLSNFRDMDLGEHYAHLEEICAALDTAFKVLSDPEQRSSYDRSFQTATTQSVRAERTQALAAEIHCRRGEELFNREQYAKAMDAFAQAMETGEQAEYQSKYALAYFMASRNDEEDALSRAMQMVQEALLSDPSDQTSHLVAATISQEAGHNEEALEHLEQLLKLDPSCQETFDEVERLLLELGQLERLEVLYRHTLHLLGERERGWSAELWSRLTLFYHDRLGDMQRARTAADVALRLNPQDRHLREVLAAMDHDQPDRWPQAVLGYRALLRSNPDQTAPLHRLFQLHHEGERPDAALVAASVATLRGVADEDERRFIEAHRPRFLRRAQRPLEPPLMESLRHSSDDANLATLFRILTPLVQRLDPLTLSDVDVTEADLIAPDRLPEGFASVLRYVAGELSMDLPAVALRPELGCDVQSAGTEPLVLLCGGDALESGDRFELCFRLARALNQLSPGRRLAGWRPRRTLRDYVLASVSVAYADVEVPDPSGKVAVVCAEIAAASDLQAAVKGAVSSLKRQAGALNLAEWQLGISRTADRVGLLLCTDLVTAGQVVAEQGQDAQQDLLDFALSETYGELRQSLGLALD